MVTNTRICWYRVDSLPYTRYKNSNLRIPAGCSLSDDLTLSVVCSPPQGKLLPSTHNKTTPTAILPHAHLHFRIYLALCCRASGCSTLHQFGISMDSWLLPSDNNIIMTSIILDQYSISSPAMLWLGQWIEQCKLTMLGFQVCLMHQESKAK